VYTQTARPPISSLESKQRNIISA